jgi:hypothetical protein
MSEASAAAAVEPGTYEHYKGARYEVLFVARHSETEETMVVYRQLYGDHAHWVRPVEMFTEAVERNGRMVPRFSPVDVRGGGRPADRGCRGERDHDEHDVHGGEGRATAVGIAGPRVGREPRLDLTAAPAAASVESAEVDDARNAAGTPPGRRV